MTSLPTPLEPRVELRGITKRFDKVVANNAVNLSIAPGEIHALLGENGAGKSTLMQILYGLYQADEGEIRVDGQPLQIRDPGTAIAHGIGMVHQEFMLVQPMTVVENVVLGLPQSHFGKLDLHAAAKRLTSLSEQHGLTVDPWARIEHLPIGVQQRVEILKLLYRDARVLILDEPTAVLTPSEKETLFATLDSLRQEGRSVVIVTHKLYEIMAIADRVSVMRHGQMIDTLAVSDTSEADLSRRMVGRDVVLKIDQPQSKPGAAVLKIDNLAVLDHAGNQKVWRASLTVRAGEIVGIAGVDGNGQSELAEALLNLRTVNAGSISLEGTPITALSTRQRRDLGIGYIPADRRGVGALTESSLADNAVLGAQTGFTRALGLINRRAITRYANELIARFDVRTSGPELHAGKLSGGNLQKLILGREVSRNPKLLVVEQPTRGLDVGAVEAVWQGLLEARNRGCAIVMISAELEEILNLSDRVAVMYGGQIADVLARDDATPERLSLLMSGGKLNGGEHVKVH